MTPSPPSAQVYFPETYETCADCYGYNNRGRESYKFIKSAALSGCILEMLHYYSIQVTVVVAQRAYPTDTRADIARSIEDALVDAVNGDIEAFSKRLERGFIKIRELKEYYRPIVKQQQERKG
jgi:hypothetical protein